MSKKHHLTLERRQEIRRNRAHRRKYNRHKKNPCPHRPRQLDSATELFGVFEKHPGRKRHNHWTARLRWKEVNTDSDGFPLIVKSYTVEVELSANNTDWFLASRHRVSAKDDFDANDKDHLIVHHIHGRLAYRYRVRALSKDCKADWSDYFVLGTPDDGPPAPFDVKILRAPHGIRLRWHAEPDPGDDEMFTQDIAFFVAELWNNPDFGPVKAFTAAASDDKFTITAHGFANGDVVQLHGTASVPGTLPGGVHPWRAYVVDSVTANTFKLTHEEGGSPINLTSNGNGDVLWGLVRKTRHLHRHQHKFRIDPQDFDEDVKFYGRVLSVSDHRSKSAWIPATAPVPNDDPGATPTGRRPLWHRHGGLTFTIPGAVQQKTYHSPHRLEDDYIVRRVTAAAHRAGAGGPTRFDIKINGGSYIFDNLSGSQLSLAAGDFDATKKNPVNAVLSRGDHLRVVAAAVPTTAPRDVTIHIVADRLAPSELVAADSGGGGGATGPINNDFADALALPFDAFTFRWDILYPADGTDLTGADKQTGEPDHMGNAGGHSVWFTFTPPEVGPWTFEVDGQGVNPALLGVYTGGAVDTLTEITYATGPTTGGSIANWFTAYTATLVANTTYFIAVDGQDGEVFGFDMLVYE